MKFLFPRFTSPRLAEFRFRYPANFLSVRITRTGNVVILITANNLTSEQQTAFVCYLYTEGFIDDFRPSTGAAESEWNQEQRLPRWIVDATWPEVDPMYDLHLRRLRLCTFGFGMAWLTCLTAWVCG